jgi:hypothetical protein
MASVVEVTLFDDVLEIESASGTRKSPSAAALNDGMLAASEKLYPGGSRVRIPLRFEFVRCLEGSHGSAVKAAPTWAKLVRSLVDGVECFADVVG